MDREKLTVVVRTTLTLLGRIASKTRTPADDVMVAILRSNEARLVEALTTLLGQETQPPTDEQVIAALEQVGIKT